MQSTKAEEKADAILRRADQMKSDRATLDSHCEEVAARVLPSYTRQFTSQGQDVTKGDKRTELMFDSTAAIALGKFGAVMESLLTPRSSKWSRIVPVDKALSRNRQAREWFEAVNDILFAYRNSVRANFSSQKQEGYIQLGAFGTDPIYIDRLAGGIGLRYKSVPLSHMYFSENHQGIIDTAYRRMPMTARQALQQWGDKVPEAVKTAAEKTPDKEFIFWHCVQPRTDIEYGRLDHKGMPFASYYVSVTGKKLMVEGGYRSFPYAIGRHFVAPGEVYGRSPAMTVLPNIKVLNEQKRTLLKVGHRAVDPVLLAHDDGVLDTFSNRPGAMNYGGVSADGRALIHAMPVGDPRIAKDMMQDERLIIKDAFYVTLFEILVEDRRIMTATEVLERTREKGVLLAPAMGRQQTESLGPMVDREIDLLNQQGLLPPMPPMVAMAVGEYKTEYDSPLSKMMRAEEATGFLRTAEFALKIANETQDPSALDWLNIDEAMPEIADINASPIRWISTPEQVAAKRKGRDDARATQQLIDAAPAAAGMVKAMGAAPSAAT
ncbi:MAG: portal protein [Pseudomonadota bacterium]